MMKTIFFIGKGVKKMLRSISLKRLLYFLSIRIIAIFKRSSMIFYKNILYKETQGQLRILRK